jgi:hypothetical protein
MTVYLGGRVCLSLTGPCVIDSGVNEGPPQLANRTLARLMCAHLPGRIVNQIYSLVHSRDARLVLAPRRARNGSYVAILGRDCRYLPSIRGSVARPVDRLGLGG